MADPAILDAIASVVAKVEAITPTINPSAAFQRSSETAPATTKARRWFDVEFQGHSRDLSNEGLGVQTHGLADRLAQLVLEVQYPVGRSELALETTLAVDSELILRALNRSADWSGTPVRRAAARTAVNRDQVDAGPGEVGVMYLVVTVDVQYRDSEA